MINKKILLCGITIALYTHVDAASSTLTNLSHEELTGRLTRLESSCPALLTKTGCPHIIPALSVSLAIPLVETLTEQCPLFDWREQPANLECVGFIAGASLIWSGMLTCIGWSVEKKREALRNALKEKQD